MAEKHTSVKVGKFPKCDICGKTARYDAKTVYGFWAYLCPMCFVRLGTGLGTGKGQELINTPK
jgi:hypothetical protein